MAQCEQKIRVGVVNTTIEVELKENCLAALATEGATVKNIIVQRPDGTTFTRPGVFTTDGTDGKIYFLTIAGDLTMSGTYYIQSYLELPSWQGHSDIGEFEVFDNLV